MRKEKKLFPCEIALLVAVMINSINLCLLVKSSFGISTLSSVPFVLSSVLSGLSFGTWTFLIQIITMIILVFIIKKFKTSYIFSFVVASFFSMFVDIVTLLMNGLPIGFWWRISYFLIGFVGLGFGAALFIKSKLPAMPFDLFVRDVSEEKNWSIRRVKIVYDLVSVGISIAVSYLFLHKIVGVGIGTIVSAFTMGIVVQFFVKILEKNYSFEPYFKVTKTIMEKGNLKDKINRYFNNIFHRNKS